MRIRSRLVMSTQQKEEMGCGEEIDAEDPAMIEGQLIPPMVPALPPIDLGALAA
jgi:hypothetical protein